ncbi:MAG: MacB family efflux pump subunit [Paludibacterium sp.]|uniref:MacB family efflux pump subunit n=1 Tax=Paludibacterium sp. TaxID=1917523 RepID=UPI0025F4C9AE|nr:MacB family efflux pump subunit [Paludibacterium sp.]MBV8048010.1 MacB family efflux pump subunit [Paludibacterium sp.]MBV8649178.1 MacB family efflux pump subunit [Paludibacterium sp.]
MREALLALDTVSRRFLSGAGAVDVLQAVTLRIHAGEMVAIVGASGSGKSTLMNLLGCLDRPTSGQYRVDGVDVSTLSPDALARLRREHFGFVFQRYHLLPHLDAVDNVAMPAVYAGVAREARRVRARALLVRLGLRAQLTQRPSQLSGGQQQRVSIARALMNGGAVILADEPTGALDHHSGQEVMTILHELNQAGHTVIIVTHDRQLAAQAGRVVELRDGKVVSDGAAPSVIPQAVAVDTIAAVDSGAGQDSLRWGQVVDAFKMALFALGANRLRSALTMLGIVIGIASVVSIVALGNGAREAMLKEIRTIGTNAIFVYRGRDWGDDKADSIRTLLPADLAALSAEPYVDSVTPETSSTVRLRWGNTDVDAWAMGGGEDVFRVMNRTLVLGRGFNADDLRRQSQVVVIDHNAWRKLFGLRADVLGQVVLIGSMPAEVIGVVGKSSDRWSSKQIQVWLPYSTVASRVFGRLYFDSLTVRIRDGVSMDLAERQVARLLTQLHGEKDFFTQNMDAVFKSINNVTRMLSLFLVLVATISLIVGGVGVMNIMLVSVSERTREIGIRMAVGARQRDVMLQFLIEAILVCLAGGAVGILLALGIGGVVSLMTESFEMLFSAGAVLLAVGCAAGIGVTFGFWPARNAARLDPVVALARE